MTNFRPVQKTGRARIWEAIRQMKTFTQQEIMAASGVVRKDLQGTIHALVRVGYLEVVSPAWAGHPARYKLIRNTGPRSPVIKKDGRVYDPNQGKIWNPGDGEVVSVPFAPDGGGLRRAWQAMRIMGTFNTFEITACGEISCNWAREYLRRIARAGYLRLVRKGIPGQPGSYHTYQLIRDTGPEAPICHRGSRRVYDPNLNQVFELAGADGASSVLRQAWQAMRVLGTFDTFRIVTAAEIPYNTVRRYVQILAQAGYLRLARKGIPGQAGSYYTYQLIRDTGPEAPICHRRSGRVHDPNLNQVFGPADADRASGVPFVYNGRLRRAWQAMRVLRTFDTFRIVTAADISYDTVKRYVQMLAQAGYLRLARKGIPGQAGSYHTYQLIRDTGPEAPTGNRRNGRVYDPNLNQVFELAGAE